MVATAGKDTGDSAPRGKRGPGLKGPTDKQERILVAYAQSGNAAAVGREMGTNERHVRLLRDQFPDRVDELRLERDQERREKADAREALVQGWVDASLPACLRRLETQMSSDNDATAFRAIKLAIDLALRVPPAMYAPAEIDRKLAEDERRIAHLIAQIEVRNEDDRDD